MDAWPDESTNRSRAGQAGSFGLCFICFQSVNAAGALPMARPGWPLLAFCTASAVSTRIAVTASWSLFICLPSVILSLRSHYFRI